MLAERNHAVEERRTIEQPRWQPPVQPRQQTRTKSFFDKVSMFGCIAVTVAAFWFLAGNSAKVDAMNQSLAKMQSTISQVSAENAALQTKVDELRRPSRILSIALGQLHMKYATPVNINTPATASN